MGFLKFISDLPEILKNISTEFTNNEMDFFKEMFYKSKLPLQIDRENDRYPYPFIKFSYKDDYFSIKKGYKKNVFLIEYKNSNTPQIIESYTLELVNTTFINWTNRVKKYYNIMRNKNIVMISEQFYNIYEDAIFLEKMGSINSGMLYRKSLEFILLDYLKYLNPNIEITKKFRIKNIKEELCKLDGLSKEKDKVLLDFIDKIFKIGHEFTHYRKQIDVDVSVLRANIEILINLISEKVNYSEQQKFLYDEMSSKN